ncbi:MAG: hypothetical protein QW035_03100 [Candidatus Anstonellales archaeon]
MADFKEALDATKQEKLWHRKCFTQRYLSSYTLKPEDRYKNHIDSYLDVMGSFCSNALMKFDPPVMRAHLLSSTKYPLETIMELFSVIDQNEETMEKIAECLFTVYQVHGRLTGLVGPGQHENLKNVLLEVVKYTTEIFTEKPLFLSLAKNGLQVSGVIPDFLASSPTLVFDMLPTFHPFIGSNSILTMTSYTREEYTLMRDINRFRVHEDYLIYEIPQELRRPLVDRDMLIYIKERKPAIVLDYVCYIKHMSNHFLVMKGIGRPLRHKEFAEKYVQDFLITAKKALSELGIEGPISAANIAISSNGAVVLTNFSSFTATSKEAISEIAKIALKGKPVDIK